MEDAHAMHAFLPEVDDSDLTPDLMPDWGPVTHVLFLHACPVGDAAFAAGSR